MLEEKVRQFEERETKRHRAEREAPPQRSVFETPPQQFPTESEASFQFLPIRPAKTDPQVASGAIMFRTPKPRPMPRKPPSSITTQTWKTIGFGESDSDSD